METILDKNQISRTKESNEEVTLILQRLEDAKNGKVMTFDESIEKYVKERNAWKSIV